MTSVNRVSVTTSIMKVCEFLTLAGNFTVHYAQTNAYPDATELSLFLLHSHTKTVYKVGAVHHQILN